LDHFGRRDRSVMLALLRRELRTVQAFADDRLVADQVEHIVAGEQWHGVPAALEDRLRRLVTAHDVHRCSHERTPSPVGAATPGPYPSGARAWGSRSRS